MNHLNAIVIFVSIAVKQNIMLKSIVITKQPLGLTRLVDTVMATILLIVIIILVYKPGAMV